MDCRVSKDRRWRNGDERDANQKISKSDRKLECIYSAEGSERIWGQNQPIHEYEYPEDWFSQHGEYDVGERTHSTFFLPSRRT